jgi:hypothetical protein
MYLKIIVMILNCHFINYFIFKIKFLIIITSFIIIIIFTIIIVIKVSNFYKIIIIFLRMKAFRSFQFLFNYLFHQIIILFNFIIIKIIIHFNSNYFTFITNSNYFIVYFNLIITFIFAFKFYYRIHQLKQSKVFKEYCFRYFLYFSLMYFLVNFIKFTITINFFIVIHFIIMIIIYFILISYYYDY